MADNLSKTEWDAGAEVSSDDIAGIHYPRVKNAWGADGASNDVSIAAPMPVGNYTDTAYIDTTTTPLLASATYTCPTWNTAVSGPFVSHAMISDQAGTHIFEVSHDGSTWNTIDSDAVAAATLFEEEHYVNIQYSRVRFINGGTNQTTFMHQNVARHYGVAHSIGLRDGDNIVAGGFTDGDVPVAAAAHDVLPAFVSDGARSLTGGDLAHLTTTTNGDLKVTVDGEIQLMGGDTAHDAPDSGNPVKVGGVARTTDPTAVAAGDRVDSYYDVTGKQIVVANAPRGRRIKNTITLSTTTETTLLAAAASTFHDLTKVWISNTSATAVRVDFRDTTAGTVLFSWYVPAGSTVGFTDSNDPIEQAAVNTNWTAQLSAAVTDVRIFAAAVKKSG